MLNMPSKSVPFKAIALIGAALVCGKGLEPYKDVCVEMIQPEQAAAVQPSDEKPPTDKMPSWQREGISIATATNMALEDEKFDREKTDAVSEGKRAAGLK